MFIKSNTKIFDYENKWKSIRAVLTYHSIKLVSLSDLLISVHTSRFYRVFRRHLFIHLIFIDLYKSMVCIVCVYSNVWSYFGIKSFVWMEGRNRKEVNWLLMMNFLFDDGIENRLRVTDKWMTLFSILFLFVVSHNNLSLRF